MAVTASLLWTLLRRGHPSPEVLQACGDLELHPLATRLVQLHARACPHCAEELRFTREILELVRPQDVPASELLAVRERLFSTLSALTSEQQGAINDVRRVLGVRGVTQVVNGKPTAELRNELAAFLGHHAADSILSRLAA